MGTAPYKDLLLELRAASGAQISHITCNEKQIQDALSYFSVGQFLYLSVTAKTKVKQATYLLSEFCNELQV
jgi:hypothetical protein